MNKVIDEHGNKDDIVLIFFKLIFYKKNNVLKDFLFGGMAVVFVLWQLIPMNEIGGDYAATAVNALFSDSNVVIVITFILALVGCVAVLSGVCLPLTAVYIFKKQFCDNVNRKLKND